MVADIFFSQRTRKPFRTPFPPVCDMEACGSGEKIENSLESNSCTPKTGNIYFLKKFFLKRTFNSLIFVIYSPPSLPCAWHNDVVVHEMMYWAHFRFENVCWFHASSKFTSRRVLADVAVIDLDAKPPLHPPPHVGCVSREEGRDQTGVRTTLIGSNIFAQISATMRFRRAANCDSSVIELSGVATDVFRTLSDLIHGEEQPQM